MRKGTIVVPSIAVALFALAVLTGEGQEAAAYDQFSAPLTVFDDCDYHCRDCSVGTDEKHDIVVHYSENEHEAQHLETCNPGSCSSHTCGASFAARSDSASLRYVVEPDASGSSLAVLVAHDPEHLNLNLERRALQVYCAGGEIVASIPLSDQQLAEIQRATNGLR